MVSQPVRSFSNPPLAINSLGTPQESVRKLKQVETVWSHAFMAVKLERELWEKVMGQVARAVRGVARKSAESRTGVSRHAGSQQTQRAEGHIAWTRRGAAEHGNRRGDGGLAAGLEVGGLRRNRADQITACEHVGVTEAAVSP